MVFVQCPRLSLYGSGLQIQIGPLSLHFPFFFFFFFLHYNPKHHRSPSPGIPPYHRSLFLYFHTRSLSTLDGSNLLYYSSGVMCVVDTTTKERKYLTCSNSSNAVITSSTLSSAGLFFATDEPNFFCLTNDFQILSYPVLVSTRIYSAMCATDTHLLLFCENGDKSLLALSSILASACPSTTSSSTNCSPCSPERSSPRSPACPK